MQIENIVYSPTVLEFVTVANEFCAFVENINQFERKEFIERSTKLLPLIYLKSILLPRGTESTLEDELEQFVTESDYIYLQQKISQKLGQYDDYQEVFDPEMQYSEGPVSASISENICDIYQDLKDFLLSYQIGTEEIMAESIVVCVQNFKDFWGQKLVNVLRALHTLSFGDVDLSESHVDHQVIDKTVAKRNEQVWGEKHFANHDHKPE